MTREPHSGERAIDELLKVMQRLRDPVKGCAWDREQTFATIAPYTIEEAYEVADAIDRGHLDDLCDELGDLLLQVVFHAQMAAETGAFDFNAVAQRIVDKMIRRHPHVFGDVDFANMAEQKQHWEATKAAEREAKAEKARVNESRASESRASEVWANEARANEYRASESRANEARASEARANESRASEAWASEDRANQAGVNVASASEARASEIFDIEVAGGTPVSALDGVARNLPALIRADKLQSRAARVGFDWPDVEPVYGKLDEEIGEVREAADENDPAALTDEIGDLLFTAVNLARHYRIDAEVALREANQKFEHRFRRVEQAATARDLSMPSLDLEALDALWEEAKKAG